MPMSHTISQWEVFDMKDVRRAFLVEAAAGPLSSGLAFLRHAQYRLRDDYVEKIRRALAVLGEDAVWARPNEASNSIGNLILHISGNMRQWIISGVGGAPDERVRSLEFEARESMSKTELLELLETTVEEAVAVLERVANEVRDSGDAPLQRVIQPQGYAQSVLDGVFHVVEHFSQHTGQILMLAKWQTGTGLELYNTKELEKK